MSNKQNRTEGKRKNSGHVESLNRYQKLYWKLYQFLFMPLEIIRKSLVVNGGAYESRTRDLLTASQTL